MLTLLFLTQTLAPAGCAPAGSSIRVEATVDTFKPADVKYVLSNRRSESLRWLRISPPSPLVVNTSGQFLKMPLDWSASIKTGVDGQPGDVEWRALSDAARIGRRSSAAFGLRGAQPAGASVCVRKSKVSIAASPDASILAARRCSCRDGLLRKS